MALLCICIMLACPGKRTLMCKHRAGSYWPLNHVWILFIPALCLSKVILKGENSLLATWLLERLCNSCLKMTQGKEGMGIFQQRKLFLRDWIQTFKFPSSYEDEMWVSASSREKAVMVFWESRISWADTRARYQGYFGSFVYLMDLWPISYNKKCVLMLFHICCVFKCHTFRKLANSENGRNFWYCERSHKKALLKVARYKIGFKNQNTQNGTYRTKTVILGTHFSTVLVCKHPDGNSRHFTVSDCEHFCSHRCDWNLAAQLHCT